VWSESDREKSENIIEHNLFSDMERGRRVINARGFLGINKPRFPSRSDQSDWRRPANSNEKANDLQPIR
jgi:hypothetical protein